MTYTKILLFVFLAFIAATCAIAQEAEQKPPAGQDSSTSSAVPQKLTRVRVGGNIASVNLIHRVAPVYPDIAKQAHISGTVVLHIVIATDGAIKELQFISGPPLLMKSAMDAVQQWRYRTTLLNGEPVEVDTTISVVYTLDARGKASANEEMNPVEVSPQQTTSQTSAPIAAEAPVAAANGQAVSVPSYPNSAGGLEKLMKDMMKLEKEGKTDDLAVYARSLTLPDADNWFKSVFGDDAGAALAAASEETRKDIYLITPATLADLRKQNLTNVKIMQFDDPCNQLATTKEYPVLLLRQRPERLYDVRFSDGRTSSVWFYFAYVDGGFRYIGKLTKDQAKYVPPRAISGTETAPGNGNSDLPNAYAPIHVGANVAAAQLIHQEVPVYPQEAKENHIQGNVVLHAIIAKDGTVRDLEVSEGACALATSALDAVKRWRYKPTLINGQPVDVDTTITVVYTLGR